MKAAPDLYKIPSYGAAYASIVHEYYLLFVLCEKQIVVHAHFSDLVLNHENLEAFFVVQNVIDERSLPAALRCLLHA